MQHDSWLRTCFRANAAAFVALLMTAPGSLAQEPQAAPDRLVVATRAVPPFAMKNAEGGWEGISIDLVRDVVADWPGESAQGVALEFRELGLEEMLTAVEEGTVDLAVAAITVNYQREKRLDFSHPFYSSGLGIAVGEQNTAGWRSVLAPLLSPTFLKIVVALLAVLLTSGVLVYFFERKQNSADFGGGMRRGIVSGIWWAAVTMTTVGYGDKVPRSTGGRMVALVWMFAGLFIIASFTAAVTSALTVTELKSRVAGPGDLPRVRVGTVAAATSESYLRTRHIVATSYDDLNSALAALQTGRIDAVVYDEPMLRYAAHQNYSGSIRVLPATFERQDYAFALPANSALRERVNQVLLRRLEHPQWEDVLAGYLGDRYQD